MVRAKLFAVALTLRSSESLATWKICESEPEQNPGRTDPELHSA